MADVQPLSDEALVLQYARFSDKSAFEELLSRHFERSYRIAARCLKDPARADDCVQEAFVAMIRAARRFDAERAFLPWWQGILFNMIRRERQRARRRKGHEERYAGKRGAREERAVGLGLIEAEIHDQVVALPDAIRAAVVLHFYEGKTHKEVARALGCPSGTASSRIRRGLEQLRSTLSRAGYSCAITELDGMLSSLSAIEPRAPSAPKLAALESQAWRATAASVLSKALITLAVVALCVFALEGRRRFSAPSAGAVEGSGAASATLPSGSERPPLSDPGRRDRSGAPGREEAAAGSPPAPLEAGGARTEGQGEGSSAGSKEVAEGVRLRVHWRGGAIAPGSLSLMVDRQEAERLGRSYEPVIARLGAEAEDIDIGALFRDESDRSGLFVRVAHPLHLGRDYFLPSSAERRERGARIYVLEAELESATILTGRVVDDEERPLKGVAIAAFENGVDGPGGAPGARARSDDRGRYRLKLGGDPRVLLVAFQAGRAPRSRPVNAEPGLEKALADWTLPRASEISGRVLIAGEAAPMARVEARAESAPGDRRLNIGPGLLRRASGIIEPLVARADTNEEGRYRIPGLARGSYSVSVTGAGSYAHPSLFEKAGRERGAVVAPRAGVDFEIGAVEVRFFIEGLSEQHLAQFIAADEDSAARLSVPGRFRVWLEPDREYVLRVARRGFEDWRLRRSFPPSPNGYDVRVTQAPGEAPPRLVIELEVEEGPSPAGGIFKLESLEDPGLSHEFQCFRGRPGIPFTFTDLSAGRWRLSFQPGALFQRSNYTAIEAEIELVNGRTTERTLTLRPGGRLRITARDARGAIVAADCRLFNDRGDRLPTEFKIFARSLTAEGDREISAELLRGRLGAGAPSELSRPLPPGRYTVELSRKKAGRKRVQVHIQAGEVSELELRLD